MVAAEIILEMTEEAGAGDQDAVEDEEDGTVATLGSSDRLALAS